MRTRGIITALAVVAAAGGVDASPDFRDTPIVYTQSPAVFEQLFQRAQTQTVHVLIFGDSQETCPGGAGAVYIPRLQYEFWRRSRNCPATGWMPVGISTGSGLPYADFLHRAGNVSQGLTATRLSPGALPPGHTAAKSSTTDGANVNGNQFYGQLLMLQHDAASVNPLSGLAGLTAFFDRAGDVHLDVMAATHPQSGELRVVGRPALTSTPDFFAPVMQTFEPSMGLVSPVPGLRVARVGPLSLGGRPYMQVELSGTDPTALTDIVAARFVNTTRPEGWSFTSYSQGQYTIRRVLNDHAGCGEMLGLSQADAAFIMFGANDAGSSTIEGNPLTPELYRADLQALIAFVRASTRPDLPIVLAADLFRLGLPAERSLNLDRYPGACYEIAQSDPLVCALNSRRLTHEAGWTTANASFYLSDVVHYSPAGAALKARLEGDALFGAFLPGACVPVTEVRGPTGVDGCLDRPAVLSVEVDAAGVVDYGWTRDGTLLSNGPTAWGSVLIGAGTGRLIIEGVRPEDAGAYACTAGNGCSSIVMGPATLLVFDCPCDGDLNRDGNVDQGDVELIADVVAGGANPGGIDADFNHDGNLDQGDVDALIDVVAGGSCP